MWDSSVLEIDVLQTTPNRMVKLKMKGNTSMTYVYKLDDRPNKTTLAAKDIQSQFIESLGGSWTYEEQNNGTLWTQQGSVVFKNNFLVRLFNPLLKWIFTRQTKEAMLKAKKSLNNSTRQAVRTNRFRYTFPPGIETNSIY